jgi:AcrR family transcriptional regulator
MTRMYENADAANPSRLVLSTNPENEPIYSSVAIQERRKRILAEARRMIAHDGIDKFSIRTLCRNADVAQRTLYNAFQSKDRLIALAISEAYEDVNRHMRYRTPPDTLVGIIDRLISVNTRNLKARNYTRAVVSLYFSPTISEDIWNALRGMAFRNLRQWLERMAHQGALEPWINVEEAAGDFANLEYSIINDWAVGRLSDDAYLPRLILSVLTHTAGITFGPYRDEAIAMAKAIRDTGVLPEFPKPVYVPSQDESLAAS